MLSKEFQPPIPRNQMSKPTFAVAQSLVVPNGSCVLKIGSPWIELLVDGIKTMEIRGRVCKKLPGTKVYFYQIGTGDILGYAFLKCVELLTAARWTETRTEHCISGERPYGESTYGYTFRDFFKFSTPGKNTTARGFVWAIAKGV